jgi:hypothetical protein
MKQEDVMKDVKIPYLDVEVGYGQFSYLGSNICFCVNDICVFEGTQDG